MPRSISRALGYHTSEHFSITLATASSAIAPELGHSAPIPIHAQAAAAACQRAKPSEQAQLTRTGGRPEARRVQLIAAVQIQAMALAGQAKTPLLQLGE